MKENRLPTILAIIFLTLSVVVGVILVESNKIFRLRAKVGIEPKYIRVTNITDNSFSISWITDRESAGYIVWGTSPGQLDNSQTSLLPIPNYMHYVTIQELKPLETYYFKIISNGNEYDSKGIPWRINTVEAIANQPKAYPVSGIIETKSGMPVAHALVYAVVAGGDVLSTTTQKDGSWYLLASQARSQNGKSFIAVRDASPIEISVFAGPFGVASVQTTAALAKPLPIIRLGESYNLKNGVPIEYGLPQVGN